MATSEPGTGAERAAWAPEAGDPPREHAGWLAPDAAGPGPVGADPAVGGEFEPSEPPPGAGPDVAPAPAVPPRPVEALERVGSVDVLRGLALMGILAMNVVAFAWPERVYGTPIADPSAGPLDIGLWAFNHLVFDTKMMTLFSMLFGAGLVLMSDRADGRGAKLRGVYYRRCFWLLVIGCVHAYLIWDGDILVMYALCGFVLYPMRHLRPRTLIVAGVACNLVLFALWAGFRTVGVPYMRTTAARVEAKKAASEKPTRWELRVHEGWTSMTKSKPPSREKFLEQIAIHRGPYVGLVQHRAEQLIFVQTIGFVLGGWWLAGGRMLIGMGLMKLGVFGAGLSRRTYAWMAAIGYGVGLPLMAFDVWVEVRNGFFEGRMFDYIMAGWPMLTLYGSLLVVAGHIGLVMLLVQTGTLAWLTRRLAAAGRMALSNYLFDSILCTTLFYGYGFDLFATLGRPWLYGLVLAIWAFQLWFSPIWLAHFRFGPAEWLWRSLTYWQLQPMRRQAPAPAPDAPLPLPAVA